MSTFPSAISKHTSEENQAPYKNTDYMRDKERRQRAARMKKLVYGTFSGIRILRQLDIATPAYWLSSAAVVRTLLHTIMLIARLA